MATASFLQTNFNTFNPSPYKSAIDANFKVFDQIANNFAVSQQPVASMVLKVAPGVIINGTTITFLGAYVQADLTGASPTATVYDASGISNGMQVESEPEPSGSVNPYYIPNNTTATISGTTLTLSQNALDTKTAAWLTFSQLTAAFTAPVTNPRIDRVVVDSTTGIVSVIAGTENASPVAPALTAGKIPLARVKLTVGMSSITNAAITDERAFFGLGSSGSYVPMPQVTIGGSGVHTTNMLSNTSYIPNNSALETLQLPASPTDKDELIVMGNGAGGWKIAQAGSTVTIRIGNQATTAGSSGYLYSNNRYDGVMLKYSLTLDQWYATSVIGNPSGH